MGMHFHLRLNENILVLTSNGYTILYIHYNHRVDCYVNYRLMWLYPGLLEKGTWSVSSHLAVAQAVWL